ncbi:MAG: DUF4347 domain-containing protein, partial [Hormoscilla sp.]
MNITITSELRKIDTKEQVAVPETKAIAFIDAAVEDKEQLVSGLERSTEVVILDSDRDGVAQITQYLQAYIRQKGAGGNVHIVSHGAPGCLYLGNGQLSLDTLEQYGSDLHRWNVTHLLLYGCNVAAGDAGAEFLEKLQAATGANIAASKTRTGNAAKGGNWNLEVTVGEVSSPLAFSKVVQNAYAGVLADVNVSITSDPRDVYARTSSISALIDNPGMDGKISLREAVIAANNTAGDDIIILTSGMTYSLTLGSSAEDAAAGGDLDILSGGGKITIQTDGSGQATVDASGITGRDRVFHVLSNADLKLENIIVTGGEINTSTNKFGGGIFVEDASLELTNSIVRNNATNNNGGGIYNKAGTVTLTNSSINDNTATDAGGGIFNINGTVNVTSSTVSSNQANFGGGIYSRDSSANITLKNSTVSGNSSTGNGAGINNFDNATIDINSSTISDNTASGGNTSGIFNRGTA